MGSSACEPQKTKMLNRYTTGQFISDTKMTIGVDFAVHNADLPENQGTATLQIWDFGGEERFRTMLPSFCQGASGALLLFDLLDFRSIAELDKLLYILRRNTRDIPIVLCGLNYGHIIDSEELAFSPQSIKDFIIDNDIDGYLSVDNDTGLNVSEAFDKLTELMIRSDSIHPNPSTIQVLD